jgi:hypothetical protein
MFCPPLKLLVGEGVRGRGETMLPNPSNIEFARMFCPPLNGQFPERI